LAKEANRTDSTVAATGTVADVPTEPVRALSPLDRKRREQQAVMFRGMSFAEMLARSAERALGDVNVVSASEAGIGYRLVENRDDKRHFVGVELFVLPGWQVNPSDRYPGRYFASLYVKTAYPIAALDGMTEFVVNDGGTGIAQQLADLRARCEAAGQDDPLIHCKRGFTVSEYTVSDDVLDDQGQPVIDPITRRPKRQPRLDPVTNQPVGKGLTFYLNTSG
jgi:hypothetical protein